MLPQKVAWGHIDNFEFKILEKHQGEHANPPLFS